MNSAVPFQTKKLTGPGIVSKRLFLLVSCALVIVTIGGFVGVYVMVSI